MSAAYHLNNREAELELNVFVDGKRLQVFRQAPKYLGVCLDRRLAGTTQGALPKSYGSPRKPWYSRQMNIVLLSEAEPIREEGRRRNHQLSTDHIWLSQAETCVSAPCPIAGIAPVGLRRKAATLAPAAQKAVKHDWHLMHDTTKNGVLPGRLKFHQTYNREAHGMPLVIPGDLSEDAWIAASGKQEWEASGPTRVHRHVSGRQEGVKAKI